MPGKMLILNAVGIVLQYALIVLLYYFLFRIVKLVYIDLNHGPGKARYHYYEPESDETEKAKLVVVDTGPVSLAKAEYVLGETVLLGRNETNDIIINDTFISSEHACITRYKRDFWLADLQSTNGTFLNNRRISEDVQLRDGDLITIGAVVFRFER